MQKKTETQIKRLLEGFLQWNQVENDHIIGHAMQEIGLSC